MTYEYLCDHCGHMSTQEHAIVTCPAVVECACGHGARRQCTGGAGFILRGHGWASDQYTLATEKPLDADPDDPDGVSCNSSADPGFRWSNRPRDYDPYDPS